MTSAAFISLYSTLPGRSTHGPLETAHALIATARDGASEPVAAKCARGGVRGAAGNDAEIVGGPSRRWPKIVAEIHQPTC